MKSFKLAAAAVVAIAAFAVPAVGYAQDAVARGAIAVAVEQASAAGLSLPNTVGLLTVPDARETLGYLALAIFVLWAGFWFLSARLNSGNAGRCIAERSTSMFLFTTAPIRGPAAARRRTRQHPRWFWIR